MPPDGNGSEWQVTPASWRRGLRRTYSLLSSAGSQHGRDSRNAESGIRRAGVSIARREQRTVQEALRV